MHDQRRVAVIGTGFIGGVHARSARNAGAYLVAVAASTPERSVLAAKEWGASRPLEGPEDLAAATDIDVVHVCTPNHLHAPYVEAALRSGKHVVCEKPLALDAATAARLTALAADNGLVATVPFVYRFYPTVREARARVASGEVGPLRLLHGSYLQDWMSRDDDWSWRVDPALGGASRAMADIGSHWCDLVEFVSGHRIARLSTTLSTVVPERVSSENGETFTAAGADGERRTVESEDTAIIVFETDRGATGSAVISQVSPGRKNRLWFELDGQERSVVFDQEHPESLWLGGRKDAISIVRDGAVLQPDAARLSLLPAGHPQGYNDCFDLFVADTYRAISGEAPEGLPRFQDGLRAARITDAALESARTRHWVEVPA